MLHNNRLTNMVRKKNQILYGNRAQSSKSGKETGLYVTNAVTDNSDVSREGVPIPSEESIYDARHFSQENKQ